MRRKQFQRGSVSARRHGRRKVWVAQWWENGGKRSKVLGPLSEVSKGQADAMLSQILAPLNEAAGHRQAPLFAFEQYVRDVFLPAMRRKWKESTRSTSEADIIRFLCPVFGSRLMHTITRSEMQRFLDEIAPKQCASIVGHLRWHLNSVYKMALSDGIVTFNPAAALFIPACKPTAPKRVMSVEEIRSVLEILELRERLVFRMAVFDGMRPGEIFAIQLGKLRPNAVIVDQRVYDGAIDFPKGRKGKNTTRIVALSPGTLRDLEEWKSFLPSEAGSAYLFPSEAATPLRPNNLWKREFKPGLEKLGLGWVNYQVLRRTNASLSRIANVDDKVSADQRGHGLGVSLAVYAISDLEQKIKAVTKLESAVMKASPKTQADNDIRQ